LVSGCAKLLRDAKQARRPASKGKKERRESILEESILDRILGACRCWEEGTEC
jgi:hypothetical protein